MKTLYAFLALQAIVLFTGFAPVKPYMPPATNYYTITGGNLASNIWSGISHTGASCGCAPCICSPCGLPSNAVIRIAHPVTISCNITIGSNTTLIIESGGFLEVTGNSSISGTGNLQVAAGGGMEVSGNLNLGGTGAVTVDGSLSVGGNLTMTGSSTLCGSGTVAVTGTVSGTPCATVVLPVELLSFEAASTGNSVKLYWSTASETQSDYFTVERSADGQHWTEVLRTRAAGSSHTLVQYTETDYQPLQGTSYYRLRQTDTDGAYSLSQVVVVKYHAQGTADIRPYPNPMTGNSFNLEFTGFGNEEVLIVVRDMQGRTCFSKVYVVGKNNGIMAVSLDQGLARGVYMVVASSSENLVSRKIVVE